MTLELATHLFLGHAFEPLENDLTASARTPYTSAHPTKQPNPNAEVNEKSVRFVKVIIPDIFSSSCSVCPAEFEIIDIEIKKISAARRAAFLFCGLYFVGQGWELWRVIQLKSGVVPARQNQWHAVRSSGEQNQPREMELYIDGERYSDGSMVLPVFEDAHSIQTVIRQVV